MQTKFNTQETSTVMLPYKYRVTGKECNLKHLSMYLVK